MSDESTRTWVAANLSSTDMPVVLKWYPDSNTVHVETQGLTLSGLDWDEFMRRLTWLITEREKMQHGG